MSGRALAATRPVYAQWVSAYLVASCAACVVRNLASACAASAPVWAGASTAERSLLQESSRAAIWYLIESDQVSCLPHQAVQLSRHRPGGPV